MKNDFALVLFTSLWFSASVFSDEYTAHEWGTFTTMSGSDGSLLAGLEVEEEALPYFVHTITDFIGPEMRQFARTMVAPSFPSSNHLPGFGLQTKMLGIQARNVTVKMETPVIYFYSKNKTPFPVDVKVGFAGGSISQWYPNRSGGEPKFKITQPNQKVDFAKPRTGSIEWKIDVLPYSKRANLEAVKANDTVNWIRPRWPDSNLIVNRLDREEKEKYLFYRGIGNFELPVRFSQPENHVIKVDSEKAIPAAIVYQKEGNRVRIAWTGKLGDGETKIDLNDAPEFQKLEAIQPELVKVMHDALTGSGLTDDEADGMIRTWWTSYFITPGTRIFWIVPRETVDRILPLKLEPAPAKLERVIVGRAEILSPSFEKELTTEFTKAQEKNIYRGSRFYKAYGNRVAVLNGKKLADRGQ